MTSLVSTSIDTLDSAALQRGILLRQLDLANANPESVFDELLELATILCEKPIGAMTLLDETRQYVKARIGLSGAFTMPITKSICQHTIQGDALLLIEDLRDDNRFLSSHEFQDGTGVRFYAGMPLRSSDGCTVGALCVMDTEPATLRPQQRRALEILARQISDQIQLRERAVTLARMSAERERIHELHQTILNNVPAQIYLKDEHGRICFYNRAVAERFNVTDDEWIGKTSSELWEEKAANSIRLEEEYAFRSGKAQESYLELPEPSGEVSYWKSSKIPCDGPDGGRMLACCSIDLTSEMGRQAELQQIQDALEEANRKLNSLALTDALTGLWNRRAFDARLETAVIGSHRSLQPLALMLLDVDNFKTINDRFGHPYGDVVLREIAAILERWKRAEDLACRFGGEEFAILMPNSDISGAMTLAGRLLQMIRSHAWKHDAVTASIGLSIYRQRGSSDELIDSADGALYRAKREGKDRIVCDDCGA